MRANGELLWQHNRLSEILANEGEDAFRKLVAAMSYASSILRARVVGSDQTLTRQSVSLAGLADVVTKFENELAALSGIPRTKLFGEVPGGLGNNAQGPHGDWDETKAAYRKDHQLPAYEWITKLVFRSLGGEPRRWKLEGNPYRHPTEQERGAIIQLEASTDIALSQAGIVTAEEVRARTIWRDRYALPDPSKEPAAPLLDEVPDDIRGETEPSTPGPAPDTPKPSDLALNGAQALALSAIIEKVAAGIIPRASGAQLVQFGFKVPPEQADAMMPDPDFRPAVASPGVTAEPVRTDAKRRTIDGAKNKQGNSGPAHRGDAISTGEDKAFLYLPLPDDIVRQFSEVQAQVAPSDATLQEIDHVTLVYCPKNGPIPKEQIDTGFAALTKAAASLSPVSAKVQGWAYFDGATKDGQPATALVALLDAPGIDEIHVALKAALKAEWFAPSAAHSFTPHFTICYLPPGGRIDDLPAIDGEFTADRVCFVNREVHEISLGGKRIDCERPIRAEDGEFQGCEPGAGAGGGGGSRETASKPSAGRYSQRAKDEAAKARAFATWLSPEEHAREEKREAEEARDIDEAVEKKLVREPAEADRLRQVTAAKAKAVTQAAAEIDEESEKAERLLTDLRALDEDKAPDLQLEEAAGELSELAGREPKAREYISQLSPLEEEDLDEPDRDDYDSEDEFAAAGKVYAEAVAARDGARAKHARAVRAKTTETIAALEALNKRQKKAADELAKAAAEVRAAKKSTLAASDPAKLLGGKAKGPDRELAERAAESLAAILETDADEATFEDAISAARLLQRAARQTGSAIVRLRSSLGSEDAK
jgi:2'-5' RNA ligase